MVKLKKNYYILQIDYSYIVELVLLYIQICIQQNYIFTVSFIFLQKKTPLNNIILLYLHINFQKIILWKLYFRLDRNRTPVDFQQILTTELSPYKNILLQQGVN